LRPPDRRARARATPQPRELAPNIRPRDASDSPRRFKHLDCPAAGVAAAAAGAAAALSQKVLAGLRAPV